MFHTPAAGTLYYRVTQRGLRPSGVLSGMGSYYNLGGRYNRVHQRTVYASDDVLVSTLSFNMQRTKA
jgi:RES domain-containing protein